LDATLFWFLAKGNDDFGRSVFSVEGSMKVIVGKGTRGISWKRLGFSLFVLLTCPFPKVFRHSSFLLNLFSSLICIKYCHWAWSKNTNNPESCLTCIKMSNPGSSFWYLFLFISMAEHLREKRVCDIQNILTEIVRRLHNKSNHDLERDKFSKFEPYKKIQTCNGA
jgi:hypothetical protein